jgi:hypothetical protein
VLASLSKINKQFLKKAALSIWTTRKKLLSSDVEEFLSTGSLLISKINRIEGREEKTELGKNIMVACMVSVELL